MSRDPGAKAVPLLVLVNLQKEFVTPGRPHYLHGIEESLENCRSLLAHARRWSWPIVHVRHIQNGHLFNEDLPFSDFVEGLEPGPHEMVFTKSYPSCYANVRFGEVMESARGDEVYLAGYDSIVCCLSTVVEGFHRGHRFRFVRDASLARTTPNADEREAHVHACDIISIYAELVTARAVVSGRGSHLFDWSREGHDLLYGGTA